MSSIRIKNPEWICPSLLLILESCCFDHLLSNPALPTYITALPPLDYGMNTHTPTHTDTHTHPLTHCGLTAAAKWSQYVCVFSSISCQFSHWHRQMHITNDNNPLSFQFTFILYKQNTEQMIPNTERVMQAFNLPEKQFDCKYLMIFIFLNYSVFQN